MKKLVVSVLLASSCFAWADARSNVGAGLGTLIVKEHDGLISQVAAVIVNGIFCNQTFAITSGTLGAEAPAEVWASKQLNNFIAENMDNLAHEIAQGEGESLEAITCMLHIEDAAEKEAFKLKLQENFDNIYTSDNITHHDVISNMKQVVNG